MIVPLRAPTLTVEVATSWDNRSETGQRVNADRPLTHSLDSTEEGLAMQATARSDVSRALDMFEALGLSAISDQLVCVTIPGPPWSKARPRFARNGHTYAKPEDVSAEQRTAAVLREAVDEPWTGNVALGCVFFRPNRQRIDADNMLKHVCDAANGVLWLDDSQCTAVLGVVELDPGNPRTLVVIGHHASTMTRGSDAIYPCVVCQKPIEMGGQSGKLRLTCSRECTAVKRGNPILDELIPCPQCGEAFRRRSSYTKFCSPTCRTDSLRAQRRAKSRPFSECVTCGKGLAHHRGGRCRDCWRADPSGRLTAEAEGWLW